MKKINWIKLFLFILASEIAGSVGSFFTIPAIPTWYNTLEKSSLTPPNYIFGPVWTLLFLLMGVSFYLIQEKGKSKKEVAKASIVFVVQFAFNLAWSFLFFGLRSPFYGLLCIVLLLALILINLIQFYKIDKTAGYFYLPYVLWVSFASYLNFTIFLLNK